MIYPIGSVYITLSDEVDPNETFGGIWQRTSKGKAIVGLDENDSDFSSLLVNNGEKRHTLIESEMPTHPGHLPQTSQEKYGLGTPGRYLAAGSLNTYGSAGRGWLNLEEEVIPASLNKGHNWSHNNLQPYQVMYIWTRIS